MRNTLVDYNGYAIAIDRAYINATALCQANGKEPSKWLANEGTTEFLDELAKTSGIPRVKLVETREGRRGGTWVHRLAWYNLGQWCNAKCAVWVAKLLDRDHRADFTRAAFGEPVPLDQLDLLEDPLQSIEPEVVELMRSEPEIQKIAEGELRFTHADDDNIALIRQRIEQTKRRAEEIGATDVIVPKLEQFASALARMEHSGDQRQLDIEDIKTQLQGMNHMCGRIEAQLDQLTTLLHENKTNGHVIPNHVVRQRPRSCTCDPAPRGNYAAHRPKHLPCPVHQLRLPGFDGRFCHRCHTTITDASPKCHRCGAFEGI